MLDAMAIRQQVIFDQHHQTMLGFVNLGTNEDDENVAKEVLVFMLVGLTGRWKAPVAYFLTKTLSATTQTTLLKACLGKLEECGFLIHSITMDGHASNQAMCKMLGAEMDLSSLQPYFKVNSMSNVFRYNQPIGDSLVPVRCSGGGQIFPGGGDVPALYKSILLARKKVKNILSPTHITMRGRCSGGGGGAMFRLYIKVYYRR